MTAVWPPGSPGCGGRPGREARRLLHEAELEHPVGDLDPGVVDLVAERAVVGLALEGGLQSRRARPSSRDRPRSAGPPSSASMAKDDPGPAASSRGGHPSAPRGPVPRGSARASFKLLLGLVEPAEVGEDLADGVLAGRLVGAVATAPRVFPASLARAARASCSALSFSSGVPDPALLRPGPRPLRPPALGDQGLESARPRRIARSSSFRMCSAVWVPIPIDGLLQGVHRRVGQALALSATSSRVGRPLPSPIAAAARAWTQARLYRSSGVLRGRSSMARRPRVTARPPRPSGPCRGGIGRVVPAASKCEPGKWERRGCRGTGGASGRGSCDRHRSPRRTGPGVERARHVLIGRPQEPAVRGSGGSWRTRPPHARPHADTSPGRRRRGPLSSMTPRLLSVAPRSFWSSGSSGKSRTRPSRSARALWCDCSCLGDLLAFGLGDRQGVVGVGQVACDSRGCRDRP